VGNDTKYWNDRRRLGERCSSGRIGRQVEAIILFHVKPSSAAAILPSACSSRNPRASLSSVPPRVLS
jgi:hypothetical protein